jgi:hypothetical protein
MCHARLDRQAGGLVVGCRDSVVAVDDADRAVDAGVVYVCHCRSPFVSSCSVLPYLFMCKAAGEPIKRFSWMADLYGASDT